MLLERCTLQYVPTMPLPFAIPVGLLLGITLAWLARAELAKSDVPLMLSRPFLITLGLAALLFAPVVGYFAAWHADWAYLYVIEPRRIPSAVDLALVLLAASQLPIGFAIAAPWALAKRQAHFLRATGALAGAIVVACAVFARRLTVSGSYAQIHGGFGSVVVGKSALGRGILLSWVALALGYGLSVYAVRPSQRR